MLRNRRRTDYRNPHSSLHKFLSWYGAQPWLVAEVTQGQKKPNKKSFNKQQRTKKNFQIRATFYSIPSNSQFSQPSHLKPSTVLSCLPVMWEDFLNVSTEDICDLISREHMHDFPRSNFYLQKVIVISICFFSAVLHEREKKIEFSSRYLSPYLQIKHRKCIVLQSVSSVLGSKGNQHACDFVISHYKSYWDDS